VVKIRDDSSVTIIIAVMALVVAFASLVLRIVEMARSK
jgi:hypothetical protein